METLSLQDRQQAIMWLRLYPQIKDKIAERELELKYPHTINDDNVGGGKSDAGNSEESKRIRQIYIMLTDATIKEFKFIQQIIDNSIDMIEYKYDECDSHITRELITELYFNVNKYPSVDRAYNNHHWPISLTTAHNRHNEILLLISRISGQKLDKTP